MFLDSHNFPSYSNYDKFSTTFITVFNFCNIFTFYMKQIRCIFWSKVSLDPGWDWTRDHSISSCPLRPELRLPNDLAQSIKLITNSLVFLSFSLCGFYCCTISILIDLNLTYTSNVLMCVCVCVVVCVCVCVCSPHHNLRMIEKAYIEAMRH